VVEAMREEYKAITDAGINLQLDDPIIVNVYEWQYSMNGDMAAFRNTPWQAYPRKKFAITFAGAVGKVRTAQTCHSETCSI